MFSTSSTTYAAAKFPCCRCLSAVSADTTQHRFVLGTGGAREQNEVQVLDFDEESNRLGCVGRVAHAGEVFALAPSPADASTFASCGGGPDASVWALDAAEFGEGAADDALSDGEGPGVLGRDQPALRRAVSNASDDGGWADGAAAGDAVAPRDLRALAGAATAGPCRSLAWSPRDHGAPNALAALDGAKLRFYDVAASAEPTLAVDVAAPFGGARATAASWSPHDAAEVHVASRDGAVRAYDARSSAAPRLVVAPDGGPCFAVDSNPNKPGAVSTAHADGTVRFYDLRASGGAPLKILRGHDGWCGALEYNKYHDQLLASGGSDKLVNLWRVSSISSAPLLELDLDDAKGDGASSAVTSSAGTAAPDAPDVKVQDYDLHDDAVVAVAWSSCDAWVFASLSFDGRVLLNHVPSPEKYKILL